MAGCPWLRIQSTRLVTPSCWSAVAAAWTRVQARDGVVPATAAENDVCQPLATHRQPNDEVLATAAPRRGPWGGLVPMATRGGGLTSQSRCTGHPPQTATPVTFSARQVASEKIALVANRA